MRETKTAVASMQRGKEKLSSGSSQLREEKREESMGYGVPLHAVVPGTTKEIKTNFKKLKEEERKKEEENPATLFQKRKLQQSGNKAGLQSKSLQLWTLVH